jgi:hypothetical protein
MKDWYRVKGGRNHLADFPEKAFNGFFVNIWLNFANRQLED